MQGACLEVCWSPPSEQSLSGSLNSSRMHTECVNTLFVLSISQYRLWIPICPGLDYYKSFLLTGFTAGPITSLYIQLRSKMSLDPHGWTPNIKCNSRVGNSAAFRQVKKIPKENQLSSDFQIFHKNQSKSSDGALFWFWNIKKNYKIQKVLFLLKPKQGLLFSESKEKDQYKTLFGQELILLWKHKTNT